MRKQAGRMDRRVSVEVGVQSIVWMRRTTDGGWSLARLIRPTGA
jgi:hypothetical protein